MNLNRTLGSRWHSTKAAVLRAKDALSDIASSVVDASSAQQLSIRSSISDCIDPALCTDCRRFTTDLLSKDVWAKGDGLFSAWPRDDDSGNPRFELRNVNHFPDDLNREPCALCRFLVRSWKVDRLGRESENCTTMYIEVEDAPSMEFSLTNKESTPQVNFGFGSDVNGTEWLERWMDAEENITVYGSASKRPEVPNSTSADHVSSSSGSSSYHYLHEPLRRLPHLASDEVMDRIQGWIKRCRDCHPKCKRPSYPLPTRVIDVGMKDCIPKLYVTRGEVSPYLTLSYCWGRKHSMVLTTATLNDFQEQIPRSARPRTIEDAIITTRRLGYRYIWIDALCILQGDEEDWQRESANMAQIYAGSHLTIAAAEAEDRDVGLFYPRHVQITTKPLPCRSHMYVMLTYTGVSTVHHLLQRRAWTMQEQILSSAVVHFTRTALLWECRELFDSDGHDKANSSLPYSHPVLKGFLLKHESPPVPSTYDTLWYTLVSYYCERNITAESDRLAALAGLADLCERESWQQGQQGRYLAGLWEGHMPKALLWATYPHLSAPESDSKVPTWSWLSGNLPGAIHWPEQGVGTHTTRTQYDCHVEAGHLLSTESRVASELHACLHITAWLQPYDSSLLNGPLLGKRKDVRKYPFHSILQPCELAMLERPNSSHHLNSHRAHEDANKWFAQILDRDIRFLQQPLYLARLCSWEAVTGMIDDRQNHQGLVDTFFLVLEATTPSSNFTELSESRKGETTMGSARVSF